MGDDFIGNEATREHPADKIRVQVLELREPISPETAQWPLRRIEFHFRGLSRCEGDAGLRLAEPSGDAQSLAR